MCARTTYISSSEPARPPAGRRGPSRDLAADATGGSVGHDVCLLRADGLAKSFGGQSVFRDVNLRLNKGEVVLLRGENGSGKTTLLNILTGNIQPDSGSIHYLADGSPRLFRFPRPWRDRVNPFAQFRPEYVAREGVGRTWQDVRLFGELPLRDNIAVAHPHQPGEKPILALMPLGAPARAEAAIRAEADGVLARLGLAGREDSSADKISLGQSKRVAIARAVAAGAHILFLDEPLAGLDRQGVKDILSLLKALINERDLTLVIVEHVFNQHHIRDLVTTDWVLKGGTLRRTVLENDTPAQTERTIPAPGRPAWFDLLAADHTDVVDERLPHGATLTRIRYKDRFAQENPPVLETENLVVQRGVRTVIGLDDDRDLTGLNLAIYPGEMAILQAPNGWGKSTLFDALVGAIPVARGRIRLQGSPIDRLPIWKRVQRGLHALPSGKHTFPSLTGRESLHLAGVDRVADDLWPYANRPTSSYSGGQKQRLALACMGRGCLNLYDEPMGALDSPEPFVRRYLTQTSKNHQGRSASLVLMPSAR